MSNIKKNKKTKESREFWAYVEKISREVEGWPDWKKSDWDLSKKSENQPLIHKNNNKDITRS